MKKKQIMLFCLFLNLGILAVVKYTNFVLLNMNYITEKIGGYSFSFVNLIVPLGISFYTFQAIGYLLDVYWEKCSVQKNYFRLLLFVSFFPQLIQGPISRYSDLSKTLYDAHDFDWKQIRFGLERILWGYFKKLVLADRVSIAVAALAEAPRYYTGGFVFVGMMLYALQLYADFTGGIDITIGIAQVFGIRVEENFIRPYFSKNIAEYWRRWHISMGTWFRDYVFYPLGISRPVKSLTTRCKKRFGRKAARRIAVYIATVVTWLATGIWHGAEWRFVIWGLANGIIILLAEECEPLFKKFHKCFPKLGETAWYRGFQIVRTFLLMSCLRLFDIYGSVRRSFRQFVQMFTHIGKRAVTGRELLGLGLSVSDYVILFLGTLLLFLVSMCGRNGSVREKIAEKPYLVRYFLFLALFLAVLLVGNYGQGYDVQQFIYNQF
jgi:D-alanyl-lipoteichoic acid acyltransferase DltB (MBOAT superfamily)